jgi:hypothetical protein
MDKRNSFMIIIFLLGMTSLACALPFSGNQPTPTLVETEASVTFIPETPVTPTFTPSPTETPAPPTQTPSPTATVQQIPCNLAEFIMDVNYPDGSSMEVGTKFTKTWRLKNVGSCIWASDYSLVFFNGDNLNAPASVSLTGAVSPGNSADLSVKLQAPSTKGTYQANFMLRAPDGVLFGLGTDGLTPFYVLIKATKANDIPVLSRNLKLNMQGEDVKMLQERLVVLGYKPGTPDGIFGPKTDIAVRAFQSDHGLTSDGIVGQLTWTKLFE